MEKKLVSYQKAQWHFIGDWIVWSILFGIISNFLSSFVLAVVEGLVSNTILNITLSSILCVGVNILITLLMCKVVTGRTFKKITISQNSVNPFISRVTVFFIICLLISSCFSILSTEIELNDIASQEQFSIFDENYFAISNIQRENSSSFEEAKNTLISTLRIQSVIAVLISFTLNLVTIIFIVVPFEKKVVNKTLLYQS